eukprot:SAG11_NODE_1577_length_4652_cov_12.631013_4_plen_267_part_00
MWYNFQPPTPNVPGAPAHAPLPLAVPVAVCATLLIGSCPLPSTPRPVRRPASAPPPCRVLHDRNRKGHRGALRHRRPAAQRFARLQRRLQPLCGRRRRRVRAPAPARQRGPRPCCVCASARDRAGSRGGGGGRQFGATLPRAGTSCTTPMRRATSAARATSRRATAASRCRSSGWLPTTGRARRVASFPPEPPSALATVNANAARARAQQNSGRRQQSIRGVISGTTCACAQVDRARHQLGLDRRADRRGAGHVQARRSALDGHAN